jgi:hypothetical protein
VQRYLKQLQELGYIAVAALCTASGWMIGQVVRVTKKALPFFKRFTHKSGATQGETKMSPIQIPSVSESTFEQTSTSISTQVRAAPG